jgi:hypothetical protein
MKYALLLTIVLTRSSDFSGTWRLDQGRSRVAADAVYSGLIGVGAPGTLHISHARSGTVVIESQINESHVRIYVPGETTTTPVYVGQPGSVAMTSRWEAEKLVSEGRREGQTGVSEIEESIGLSSDGHTLEIEILVQGPDGESSSTLRYTRIESVGTCESWPSPCKK